VSGTGFTPLSRVQFDDVDRLTTYVSSTQLTVLIPATDLTPFIFEYGESIQVKNPAPGGGISNAVNFTLDYPLPTITSISPSSAVAGSFGFEATVNGTGFMPNSTAQWNGQHLATAPLGPNQLSLLISTAELATAGTVQITITNQGPGGGTSNAFAFTVQANTSTVLPTQPTSQPGTPSTKSQARLSPPLKFLGWKYAISRGGDYLQRFMRARSDVPLPSPKAPGSFTAPSLASSASTQNTSTVAVPGFVTRKPMLADFLPTGVVTGDFNRDGHMDWIVSSAGGNDLWVYFGNGDGTAAPPTIIPLRGQTPLDVVAADLRHIGILDLIVAEPDSATIEVLLGNGDGTFKPGALYYTPAPPLTLAAADFNGDGKIDVVVGMAGDPSSGPLATLLGDGTGRLGQPIISATAPFTAVPAITSMAVADFNQDGLPDVVAIGVGGNFLVLPFLSRGDGTFKQSAASLSTPDPEYGPGFLGVAAGDVNGDGCPDAVITDTFGNAVVFLGNCNGSFQDTVASVKTFGVGDVAQTIAVVDVNHDGKLDIVTSGINIGPTPFLGEEAGNLVSVLLGDGSGNFSSPHVFAGEPSMVALSLADLNGDGFPDIVTANQDTDSTSIYLNDGHGGFGDPEGGYNGYLVTGNNGGTTNPAGVNHFLPVDINGDGKTDLAAIEIGKFAPYPFELTVMLNDGTGKFGPPIRTPVFDASLVIGDFKMADFRNTGHPDFLAVESVYSTNAPFLVFAPGRGDGTFGPPSMTTPVNAQGILGVGDFNGDGKLDFVVSGYGSSGLFLTTFFGDGTGNFAAGPTQTFGAGLGSSTDPSLLFVGDYNHDGKLDVLVWVGNPTAGDVNHNVYEFLGNGDGSFAPAKLVLPNFGPFTVTDLNHDGLPDIVEITSNHSLDFVASPSFAIYLGQPDGSFTFANTVQPYPGIDFGLTFGGPINQTDYSPLVADFNGDGNADIAVFELALGNSATPRSDQLYMQIIAGNGDGTFTPSYNVLRYRKLTVPQTAVDVTGDGRADLIEFDQYTSSYHVIAAQAGPAFQIQMKSEPTVGQTGGVLITMSVPAPSARTIQLQASNPAIQIPASVVIPAGTITQEVDFQIASGFNPDQGFSIQAQLGAETEMVYGSQWDGSRPVGFQFLAGTSANTFPGGTTGNYGINTIPLGGYSTSLQMSCQGLPAGASCVFGENPLLVSAGLLATTSLVVAVAPSMPLGSYPFIVTATDGSFSQHVNASLVVGSLGYTVSMVSSANPSVTGQSVTFGATLTLSWGGPVPAGTAVFLDGSTSIGAEGTNAGYATVSTSSLTIGSHSITVQYSTGSTSGNTSTPPFAQTVNKAATSTIVTPSANPLPVGQAVTLTATVSVVAPGAGIPTGMVTFYDGTTSIGTGALNASGVATFVASSLTIGKHSITANYPGDGSFVSSTSPIMAELIQTVSSTTVASSLNPSVVGESVTLTATVTGAVGTPTGSVTFYDGATSLGTSGLNGSGIATDATAALVVGSRSIIAIYGGDQNYASSASPTVTQMVNVAGFAPVSGVPPVTAGLNAIINLTLYAASGSGLNFTLGCLGTPPKSSCLFNQNPSPGSPPPAGTTIQMTFMTSDSELPGSPSNRSPWPRGLPEISASLAALFAVGIIRFRHAPRWLLAFSVCWIVLVLATALVGCAGGGGGSSSASSYTGTPKGPATFTVTGTSGTTTISTSVSVTIQ